MSVTQGMHIMPTKVQHNYLFGTGLDKTLSGLVSQDFSYKAIEDGVVTGIDEKNKLVFLKYSDGTKAAIDISNKSVKNSASGFFVENKLILNKKIKVGSKFKKGNALAVNEQFFKEDMDGSNGFSGGRLTKVALMSIASTFEDSSPIIETLKHELASEIITEKQTSLKENSNIISIVKIGDKINVNDPLIIFEEVGDTAKEALDALDRSFKQVEGTDLEHIGRNVVKSKYSGVIVDIKLHYNCNLDSPELQPSLKEYTLDYIKKNKKREKLLEGNRDDELIELPSTNRIMSEKILGTDINGVLLSFYIQHEELNSIGSKISFFSACKGIVSEVIPDEVAPLSDHKPEYPIETFLSPMSVIARNLPDVMLIGFTNKVLIELKEQCLEELGMSYTHFHK